MASIFANAFRTQARVAFVASRARISPSTTTFFGLLTPHSVSSFSARPLSTSQVIRFDYNESGRITEPNNTLYLGNLPYSVGEQELEDLLSAYGTIKEIRLGQFFLSLPLCTIFLYHTESVSDVFDDFSHSS
jgi:hypothetical protein